MDRSDVALGSTSTALYRGGSGRALVLLHGGGLDSAHLSWAGVWDRLARNADVIVPDQPGYGDTRLGRVAATLEGYRDWLLELLDALKIGRAVLMGLSLGGGVAIRTALDRPDRVAALALCAPYGVSPKTPWGRAGYVLAHTPGANALTWRLVEHSDAMARWSLKGLLHRTSPSAELVSEVRKLAGLPQAGRAWTAFQHDEVTWSGPRTYYGADFPQLVCPVTMLSGDHDGLVPRKDVEAAAARIPDCRFVSVPGAGHWLPRDAPESVLDAAGALVA